MSDGESVGSGTCAAGGFALRRVNLVELELEIKGTSCSKGNGIFINICLTVSSSKSRLTYSQNITFYLTFTFKHLLLASIY